MLDGASHALSLIGAVCGAPVVPLGVDSFGQSGTVAELYAYAGIDVEHIVEGALHALELGNGGGSARQRAVADVARLFGGRLAPRLPVRQLVIVFVVILVYLTGRMLWKASSL